MGDFMWTTDRGRALVICLSTNINVDMQVMENDGSMFIADVENKVHVVETMKQKALSEICASLSNRLQHD